MKQKLLKNITFIGPSPPPLSGSIVKNSILLNCLESVAETVTLLSTTNNRLQGILRLIQFIFSSNRYLVISVSSGGRKILLPLAYLLKNIFDKSVILIPCGGALPEELGTMGTFQFKCYKAFYNSLEIIYVETNRMGSKLKEVLPGAKVEVMYNFKPRPDKEPVQPKNKKVQLVFLSFIRRDKGIFVLLDAVKILKEKNLDISLDIYGNFLSIDASDKNKFKEIVDTINYVNWHGLVDPADINDKLQGHDIFVFPTFYKGEGFPGVLIDSAYAGLPVIATRFAYNEEIIEEGEHGLLCIPNDIDSLAACIEKLYHDPENRRLMSKNNWSRSYKFDSALVGKRIGTAFLQAE